MNNETAVLLGMVIVLAFVCLWLLFRVGTVEREAARALSRAEQAEAEVRYLKGMPS